MTRITFYRRGGIITGLDVSGHSGYAQESQDIICAAVTGAVRLVECILNDVMKLGVEVHVDPDAPSISLVLPDTRAAAAQDVLSGMIAYLQQLGKENPCYIKIREA